MMNHLCGTNDKKQALTMIANNQNMDIDDCETRSKLKVLVHLLNFNTWAQGHCNNRDGPVLGRHPGVTIPDELSGSEGILVSFYLNHVMNDTAKKTYLDKYETPIFVDKHNQDINARMSFQHPIKANELWLSPHLKQIHWKKRKWGLSAHMRDIAGVKFPEWVMVLTPKENGILNYAKSVRSAPYSVRSKKQPNASTFAAGGTVVKRRTPETFRAEQALKAEQADILHLNDRLKAKNSRASEFQTRLEFALAITQSDPALQHLCAGIIKHMRKHKM
tara:strand:+ start:57 stop:884 length:828 start_codon:yes stop_codon:yes gene_type:complete